MISVHAFYTSGMHGLAKVFVESFSWFHTQYRTPLHLDTMGLTTNQIAELRQCYPLIRVVNHEYPMADWANRCGVSIRTLAEWKDQIEHGYVTEESRTWKLLTAGDYRVRCVSKALNHAIGLLVHFDIDTLFRGSVLGLETNMVGYDVGLKFRPNIQPIKARITIDVMALRPTQPTYRWLSNWQAEIAKIPPRERPIGFGQSSCWEAYTKALEQGLTALRLPLSYGLPGRNRDTDVIWCGNIHKLRKDDCVSVFRKELDRLKNM